MSTSPDPNPETASRSGLAAATPARRLTRWRRFEAAVGRVTLMLVLCLATLLLADTVARKVGTSKFVSFRRPFGPTKFWKQPRPYIHHAGAPGATLPGGGTLNRFGCRGPQPRPSKGTSEIRIFMVGGSTTYLGSPPAARLIQNRLNKLSANNVWVFNFGVGASVSSMELVRIVTEISELEPDLVLMYGGGNDVIFPMIYDPRPGYPYNYPLYERNPLIEEDYDLLPLIAFKLWTVRRTADGYLREGFTGIEALRQEVGFGTPEWREEIATIYVRNLEKACRISSAFDSEFLGVFQPARHYTYEDESQPKREHCLEVRQHIRSRIRALGPEVRDRVVDLSDLFDGRQPEATYRKQDELHITEEARQVVADAITEEIVKRFPGLLAAEPAPTGQSNHDDQSSPVSRSVS